MVEPEGGQLGDEVLELPRLRQQGGLVAHRGSVALADQGSWKSQRKNDSFSFVAATLLRVPSNMYLGRTRNKDCVNSIIDGGSFHDNAEGGGTLWRRRKPFQGSERREIEANNR